MLPIDAVGVKPGVYKHYKGNSYRVLFVAPWWSAQDQLKADDQLSVVAYNSRIGIKWHTNVAPVLDVLWSGNDFTRLDLDDQIVIYVALYGDGRVSARTVEEFEEQVQQPGDTFKRPRFEWVGP